jgi:hypothetical protein
MFTLECAGILATVLMLILLLKQRRDEAIVAALEAASLT